MPESMEDLIAVLKSDAPQKKKVDACRQLAVIGTKDAVPALAAFLADEKLSHMARYALEPIPDVSVDAALLDALGTLKGKLLVGVIGSLGVRRQPRAAAPLGRLLADGDVDVVATAARSLGRIGTPEAGSALKEKVGMVPAAVRPAVADGCLSCAEKLLAAGKRGEAAALLDAVAKADVPKHVSAAAQAAAR